MKYFAILVLALLSACGPEPDTVLQMRRQTMSAKPVAAPAADSPRFTVTRVGVFEDDLAYNSRRGIYVIVDNATGKEFVGISGVGISETGSHRSGKTQTSDER